IHTYVWGGSSSANARRVAAMENDALEFEVEGGDDALEFIMRDLQVNEHNRESTILANYVQNAGAAVHPGANRGVDQANFHVLRNANRPAVLIEAGFATNRNDARFLDSVTGQRRLADAIANGIVEYLREYESKLLSSSQ
ncbi:MAG: N-acetylmuramoyl-L-alanine amidase, partial [Gemmatimonadales bacterium]